MIVRTACFVTAGLVGALSFPPSAFAAVKASAEARVQIVENSGIEVISPVTLGEVTTALVSGGMTASVNPGGASDGAQSGGSGSKTNGLGNAELTVRGQSGDVLSVAVPDNLTLVRSGGSETLTLNTGAEYGLAGQGVLLGGQIINGNAISVDVGDNLSLASANHLVPGPYKGLFVVVVQYN